MTEALFSLDAPSKPRPIGPPDRRNRPRARKTDPVTSVEAAEVVAPHASVLEELILETFAGPSLQVGKGGLTDDDLVKRVVYRDPKRNPGTIVTARARLYKRGVLVATEHRRLSRRGVPQIVWKLR